MRTLCKSQQKQATVPILKQTQKYAEDMNEFLDFLNLIPVITYYAFCIFKLLFPV